MDSCAPLCDSDTVSGVRAKTIVADTFGALALVSVGVAGYLYWSRPTLYRDAPATQAVILPTDSGVFVGLWGSY
jgi:hypothetical protein